MNLTPYGLKLLVERSAWSWSDARDRRADAVRAPAAARPGVLRPLLGPPLALQPLLDGVARVTGWDAEDRNAIKLLFSGQYAFIARRLCERD